MKKTFSLKPETICGYKVDSESKKVWQVELDLLSRVDKICRKHKINYSLSGGSLLGAIRHKGFIPWDNDVDLVMLRADYNRFLELAQKELGDPFFVQYCETEPLYDRGHAQIRNSNTTAIINTDIVNPKNYNKGIFIDIFPLDNIPDDPKQRKRFVKKAIIKKTLLRGPTDSKFKLAYQKIRGKQRLIDSYHNFVQRYDNQRTEQVGAIEFRPDEFKYDRTWFDEYIEVPFENLTVKITKSYDALLTRQYGDYMTPPKNKGGNVHGDVFFDTENSYTKYNNKIKEICEKL